MRKLGFSFSWKRLLGITKAKQSFNQKTGIHKSKTVIERKIDAMLLKTNN